MSLPYTALRHAVLREVKAGHVEWIPSLHNPDNSRYYFTSAVPAARRIRVGMKSALTWAQARQLLTFPPRWSQSNPIIAKLTPYGVEVLDEWDKEHPATEGK